MKNLKNLYHIAIFVFAIVFVLAGCKKEEVTTDSKINNNIDNSKISVIDGRLVFQDEATFKNYLDFIYENQAIPEKINKMYKQNDFTSMMEIYHEGMQKNKETDEFSNFCEAHPSVFSKLEDEESIIYELEIPFVLAHIANENGIYQVGQKIIRATESYTITITDGNETKIPILMQSVETISDKSIDIKATKLTREYSYKTAYFDSKHRIVARLYSAVVNSEYFYEARTTAQKKGWTGIWTQENISQISVARAQGYAITAAYGVLILPLSVMLFNNSDVQIPVCYSGYLDVIFNQSTCLITHYGYRNSTPATIADNEAFPD